MYDLSPEEMEMFLDVQVRVHPRSSEIGKQPVEMPLWNYPKARITLPYQLTSLDRFSLDGDLVMSVANPCDNPTNDWSAWVGNRVRIDGKVWIVLGVEPPAMARCLEGVKIGLRVKSAVESR